MLCLLLNTVWFVFQWPLGGVVKVLPDKHGLVRTAVVKMKGSEYKHPRHKICLIKRSNEFVCRD